jgi:hypothetical protein
MRTTNPSAVAKSANVNFFAMAPAPARSHPAWALSQPSTLPSSSFVGRAMGRMVAGRGAAAQALELPGPTVVSTCMMRGVTAALRYAHPVALLACPFCREMFERGERPTCPVCGVSLVAFEKLPVSDEALSEDGVVRQPEWEPLPVTYLRRGRGALALLAVAGLVAFFAPWVDITMPDVVSYSGFEMARRLGWAWGAGVAWFVLFPMVLTRRSVMKMRGARVAASFLAAVPGLTAALLLAGSQHGSHGVPLHFSWAWGLFATLALSVVALPFAFFFGGRVDDLELRRGTSAGQVVH